MKAIARYPDHGAGTNTFDTLEYMFMPVKSNMGCSDRVVWIGGDLDGYGLISRKAALMALALDYGHEHMPGRRYWHVVLSCEPCTDQESRADAFLRLKESAPLLAVLHGAKRWIAILHCDTDCPHLHLIFANFDEMEYCRFTYDIAFLKKVQLMNWTPYLESGKECHIGGRGPRGKKIAEMKENRRQEDPEKREAVLQNINAYCAKHAPTARSPLTLAKALSRLDLPSNWDDANLMTKKGEPKKNASVTIDGVVIRLAFYFRWLRGLKRPPKEKSKGTLSNHQQSKAQPQPDLSPL